jgi:tetratricopeptide (TPR) repeat protein
MARRSKAKLLKETRRRVKTTEALVPVVESPANQRVVVGAILTVFLLLFGLLTVSSFLQKSPTVDEPSHLLSGYSALKWRDFRTNPEHPPLAKMLAALPLLWIQIKDPRPSSPDWELIPDSKPGPPTENLARQMFFNDNDGDRLFFYAKLPMVTLGMVLGIFIFLWTKEIYGIFTAAAALMAYCLDPSILAHGAIVHTDIPFTTFAFISCCYFWRSLQKLNWVNLALTSVFFALAANTKYSIVTILPIWCVWGAAAIYLSPSQLVNFGVTRVVEQPWARVKLIGIVFASALVTAYFAIWMIYGFRFQAIPGHDRWLSLAPVMPDSAMLRMLTEIVYQYRVFPEAWIYGQLYILKELGRASYLLGETSADGFWLYFPVVIAVKTPLPLLILLFLAAATWFKKRRESNAPLFLMLAAFLYLTFAITSRMNIGQRHILPIYPFVYVLIGGASAALWESRNRTKRGCLVVLALWYIWSSVSVYPHYLSYFNEIAGGPENGHRFLIDSNLDWGQDLKGLKRWMDRHEKQTIQLSYFGTADPDYYGIRGFYLPGSLIIHRAPENGVFQLPQFLAVSANLRFGDEIFLNPPQRDFLRSYQLAEPIDRIGYSILIYKVDLSNPSVYYNAGLVLASRNELRPATDLFRQAIQIQPEFADAHLRLAQVLALEGKQGEAYQHYNEAIRLRSSSPASKTP